MGDQEVLVFEGFAPLISEKIFTGPVQPLLEDRDDCRVERDATVLTGLCFISADQDSGYNVYILLFYLEQFVGTHTGVDIEYGDLGSRISGVDSVPDLGDILIWDGDTFGFLRLIAE